jgi:hypothetical protein
MKTKPAIPIARPETRPVRLGVLTNPVAQHNHRFPFTHRRLGEQLASTGDAIATADPSQIDEALRFLLFERGVTVLAINGGDGTIHGTINHLAALLGPDVLSGQARFPTLLMLNGGTYNMASRAMGTKADPVTTVRRFQDRHRGGTLGAVQTRSMGLLEIRADGMDPMLGMVFGSQVVRDVLELCDDLGSGYLGLASLLAKGVMGSALQTRFFRENLWRLRPRDDRIWVDGRLHTNVLAAAASTIDLKLARGLVWALTIPPGSRGFHAKVIRAKSPSEVVHVLPHLLWELSHPMIGAHPEAERLVTHGSFTVDGELHEPAGRLEVTLSSHRFDVVSGDDL